MNTLIPRAPTTTAEWQCTACDSTNRRLVPKGDTEAIDRCVSCKTKHFISAEPRPVRWAAKAC